MSRRAPGMVQHLLLACVALGGSGAAAQDADAQRRASVHFERGTEFFNEGRFDAALAEFERAYAIAPAHPVLYNLARVHEALGRSVEAADTYARYLAEAGYRIDAARRREVEQALDRNRARIARLMVRTNVAGATLSVDEVDVATTPLPEALRLSAGTHTVGARAAGYDSIRRSVQLAGGVEEVLTLELSPLVDQRGTLRIVSNVAGVQVTLDGRSIGTTPLVSTVPVAAGAHVVVGTRDGYHEARVPIDVEHGAETEVRLRMELDEEAAGALGHLVVHLPDAPYVLEVDGETMPLRGGGLRLPGGLHELELDVAERERWRREVEVPAGGRVDVTPELLWTPQARAERVSSAAALRTTGQVIALAGGLALLGGGGVFLWNLSEISATDREVETLNADTSYLTCADMGWPSPACDGYSERKQELDADQERQNTIRTASAIVTAAGAAVTLVGVVLWTTAPTEDAIDAAAHAAGPALRLRAGLGSLSLDGTF